MKLSWGILSLIALAAFVVSAGVSGAAITQSREIAQLKLRQAQAEQHRQYLMETMARAESLHQLQAFVAQNGFVPATGVQPLPGVASSLAQRLE